MSHDLVARKGPCLCVSTSVGRKNVSQPVVDQGPCAPAGRHASNSISVIEQRIIVVVMNATVLKESSISQGRDKLGMICRTGHGLPCYRSGEGQDQFSSRWRSPPQLRLLAGDAQDRFPRDSRRSSRTPSASSNVWKVGGLCQPEDHGRTPSQRRTRRH